MNTLAKQSRTTRHTTRPRALALSIVAALGLTASAASAASGTRVLLEADGFTVSTHQQPLCADTVALHVSATNPQLFSGDSQALQKATDATRAMLSYACGFVPDLELNGHLRGLTNNGTPVFHAMAGAQSDWRVQADRKIDVARISDDTRDQPTPRRTAGNGAPAGQRYEVLGLHTGMGLAAARNALRTEFGIEPSWQPALRRLVVNQGDCTAAFDDVADAADASPGSRCLQAFFSGHRRPRLSSVDYVQVVEERARQATSALRETYGRPASRTVERGYGQREIQLGWGARVGGSGRYTLQAKVLATREQTVVMTTLEDPAAQTADNEPDHRLRF